ncbi:MAG: TlpA family protein disulfide reductase [Saprospiraceae bacterium]
MASKQQNKIVRLILATLVLLFVLVILPLGSWYYLRNGLNYRVTTMSELNNYGKLPDFSYNTVVNTQVQTADLQGKVAVANVLDLKNEALSATWGTMLEKLHDQFNERNDVRFLIYVTDTARTTIESFTTKYKLQDYEQCYFIPADADVIKKLPLDHHIGADSLLTHLTLVDTKGMVRKHYNVQDQAQVKRLVEHMALLLPLQKREEISLQREPEK